MSLISSIGSLSATPLQPSPLMQKIDAPGLSSPAKTAQSIAGNDATQAGGFSSLFDQLVDTVDAKQSEASQLTRQVLLGQTDQLHQSVIAMQEASVAFSMMVEVRNKLVESYQELMRMPV